MAAWRPFSKSVVSSVRRPFSLCNVSVCFALTLGMVSASRCARATETSDTPSLARTSSKAWGQRWRASASARVASSGERTGSKSSHASRSDPVAFHTARTWASSSSSNTLLGWRSGFKRREIMVYKVRRAMGGGQGAMWRVALRATPGSLLDARSAQLLREKGCGLVPPGRGRIFFLTGGMEIWCYRGALVRPPAFTTTTTSTS